MWKNKKYLSSHAHVVFAGDLSYNFPPFTLSIPRLPRYHLCSLALVFLHPSPNRHPLTETPVSFPVSWEPRGHPVYSWQYYSVFLMRLVHLSTQSWQFKIGMYFYSSHLSNSKLWPLRLSISPQNVNFCFVKTLHDVDYINVFIPPPRVAAYRSASLGIEKNSPIAIPQKNRYPANCR